MIERTERIESQCPCGQPLVAVIFHHRTITMPCAVADPKSKYEKSQTMLIYALLPDGEASPQSILRCPVCNRDFSRLMPEQIKESWNS